jgi:hypothetical protein
MKKIIISIVAFPLITLANTCFEKTFCATGDAPKFILCGRGQDCSKAVDLGMQFKKDCTVTWWLGDAADMRTYKISKNRLMVLPRNGSLENTQKYLVSKDQKQIKVQDSTKYIYSTAACAPAK